jgi:hypothetical protein
MVKIWFAQKLQLVALHANAERAEPPAEGPRTGGPAASTGTWVGVEAIRFRSIAQRGYVVRGRFGERANKGQDGPQNGTRKLVPQWDRWAFAEARRGTSPRVRHSSSMREERVAAPAYVIKALELYALEYLPDDFPRPQGLEWINRGRNTRLKRTSAEMLVRTLFRRVATASVNRLHEEAGLRVYFRTAEGRNAFARLFKRALVAASSPSFTVSAAGRN